jgi:hypothetical protein
VHLIISEGDVPRTALPAECKTELVCPIADKIASLLANEAQWAAQDPTAHTDPPCDG